MRLSTWLALFICLGLAQLALADPPSPLIADRGLVVHCSGNGEPSTYGDLTSDGGWDYSVPGIGSTIGYLDRNIYYTTNSAGTHTPMDSAIEWVIQIELRWNQENGGRAIEFVAPGDDDILRIYQDSAANGWYMEGDPAFGSAVWFDTDPPLGDFCTLTIHYMPDHPRPDRTNAMDVWVNNDLAYEAITCKNTAGDYALELLALQGYTSYDEITIGAGPNTPAPPKWYSFSDMYTAWQASHPFMLGALHNSVPEDQLTARTQRFAGTGLNTLIWWKPGNAQHMFGAAHDQGLQWACGSVGGTSVIAQAVDSIPGCAFIMAGDEPSTPEELPPLAAIIDWVHNTYPDLPAFTNLSISKIDHDLYITTCNPDIFSFDHYPLHRDGSTSSNYLSNVGWGRQTAQNYQLPYWMFLQAYGRDEPDPSYAYRIPDQADMRYLVFSFLAHGGTGIMLFTYYGHPEAMVWDPCMPESPLVVDHIYEETITSRAWHAFRDLAPEVKNLAATLIDLRSKDAIGYVGTIPSGCWAYSTHGDLLSVAILDNPSDQAMVGWFADEGEQEYFMVVNLVHGADLSKMDAARAVRLTFDSSVTQIERRNRQTGLVETLNTKVNGPDRILDVWLPGGTGDLFKWSNGQAWK